MATTTANFTKLDKKRKRTIKTRDAIRADRQTFFRNISQARYVLRRIFRLIEDEARRAGIDPLVHQALVHVYGADNSTLRVKDLAERLDISPAFASVLVKSLFDRRFVTRNADSKDKRVAWVTITDAGREIIHTIDEQLQVHVEYFRRTLDVEDREATIWIIMFYLGLKSEGVESP